MKTFIYTLTDPITNKIRYIGKSIKPEVRFRQHIIEAKRRKYINHKNNWIFSLLINGLKPNMEIIDETDGPWEWLEQYWIYQFKSWGFELVNGTDGGDNPPSWKGRTHSDEYKKIRRKIMQENNPSKNMDDNWRNNISLAHKSNNFTPTKAIEAIKKEVSQFTLDGEFIKTWSSISEAANFLNLSSINGIVAVCRYKRFKSGGFRWSYNEILKPYEPISSNKIKINQLSLDGEFIKTWSSISEAAYETNTDTSAITKVCKNKQKTTNGFKWTYYE